MNGATFRKATKQDAQLLTRYIKEFYKDALGEEKTDEDINKKFEAYLERGYYVLEKEGKLYGLGTADMKGGIAAMLDAVIETELSTLKYGIKLYFTYDEEIGFSGVYDITKSNEKLPETMIFGEPTNNEILVGNFITEASFVDGCKKVILGVEPVTAHEVNEHITVESYNQLVEQYKEIIKRVCM